MHITEHNYSIIRLSTILILEPGVVLGGFTGFQKPVKFTELAYNIIVSQYTLIKQSRLIDNILIR